MSITPKRPSALSRKAGVSRKSSSQNSAAFLESVASFIARHDMIASGNAVLVAFSGGPDSTALLHALYQLKDHLNIKLSACHIHHGLRGKEADADAAHAAAFTKSLKVPFVLKRADVRAYAKSGKLSLETAGRELRYALLDEAAQEMGAGLIATGHTADDQAETVLWNLIRGAGPTGLAGIPPVRGRIIRPLLGITRAEVEKYCRVENLAYRIDKTNLDLQHTRNRIRHEILPALREIQPGVNHALHRTAEIMRGENELMELVAQREFSRLMMFQSPRKLRFDRLILMSLPHGLLRRILRKAIAYVKGNETDLELERIEALTELIAEGRTGAVIELPGGMKAERTYNELVLSSAIKIERIPEQEWFLRVPGSLFLSELNIIISAKIARTKQIPDDPYTALLDAVKIKPPLIVRNWHPGDRFTPLGMRDAVKLQDFFVNEKIPRSKRRRVPLVMAGDEIVWVVGHRISDHCKVTQRTRRRILLEAKRISITTGEEDDDIL